MPARAGRRRLTEPPDRRAGHRDLRPARRRVRAAGAGWSVLTEADLTGTRAAGEVRKLASRRRNAVDLVTLKPGDYVVHAQHGIGRFVEMGERTVGGATREYLVVEYALASAASPATGCSCRPTRWTRSAATSAARCRR